MDIVGELKQRAASHRDRADEMLDLKAAGEIERLRGFLGSPSGSTSYLCAEVERLTAENAKYKVALSKIIKADWAGNCDDGYSVGHIAMAALAEAVRP